MATGILPSLLAAYTLATLLHLYAAVQRAQRAGLTRTGAVDRALSETRKPGAFNVLTTGAGLLSLTLVPIPPIQVFGVAGAIGTLLVFLTVFFLVPPFLARWDKRPWPQRSSGMGRLGRIAPRLVLFSMRRPKTMVLVFAVLLVAAFPLTQQVKVESDVLAFFPPDHPVSRHTALIESKLSGVTSLEISLVGEGRDSLQSVARLQAMRDLQSWLEALPEVDRTVSMADLVEEMNWAMNGEKPAFRAIPRNDRLLRQYLLVYDGEDLYELVDREFQHARIVLNLNVHGATEIGLTIEKIRQRLAAEPLPGLQADIGGYGRLFADQVDLLVSGQVNSFAGAFVQIFLLMAIMWRSFGAAALCIVPNLAPLYFIFVLMGATGIHLDLATVMIAGVILGITVDDTIHLYHGYRDRRLRGISPLLAIARSFESSGRAVLATTLLLVAQFMLLATSDFIPTANFGLMTAVGLFAGQFAEMLLLPALLVLKDAWRTGPKAKRAAATADTVATEWAPTEIYQRSPAADPLPLPLPQTQTQTQRHIQPPSHEKDFEPPAVVVAVPAQGMAAERRVLVCQGNECMACGAAAVWQRLSAEKQRLEERPGAGRVLLTTTGCLGPCEGAPVVQVYPGGRYFRGPDPVRLVRAVCDHLLPAAADPEPTAAQKRPQPEEAS
ncbi:MAG TPA: MMPL family transporter, partial [Rubrivivax sp.]|nr:MMPL family transporter [Rubrivivax sp.]